jgi:DNA-binding LacI/PurR family transcriptional regulator
MKKKITVYDIAKEANVSPSTVSRILTGSAKVSPKKREIVEELIKKYDFYPNILARSLTKNETKSIGFILPDITNPFFSTVLFETEKQALEKGYTILLGNSMGNNNVESMLLKMFLEKQVDAIVFMGGRINNVANDHALTGELSHVAKSIPIIMVNGKNCNCDNCYSVNTNEKIGLTDLIEYLISLGHTKLGILGGHNTVTTSNSKYNIFRKVLNQNGIECNESWIIQSDFSMDGGIEAVNKLLSFNTLPTAIIGINDYVAIGIMRALQDNHFTIPEDISVAGFDGSYLSLVTNPALTTVSQNYENIGKRVIETIIDIASGNSTSKTKTIETKLIIRDSCKRV